MWAGDALTAPPAVLHQQVGLGSFWVWVTYSRWMDGFGLVVMIAAIYAGRQATFYVVQSIPSPTGFPFCRAGISGLGRHRGRKNQHMLPWCSVLWER